MWTSFEGQPGDGGTVTKVPYDKNETWGSWFITFYNAFYNAAVYRVVCAWLAPLHKASPAEPKAPCSNLTEQHVFSVF